MILIECWYAEHRCKLFRVREGVSGILYAERVEPTAEMNNVKRFRPAGDREMERSLAGFVNWALLEGDMEKISGLAMPVAADWIRDNL